MKVHVHLPSGEGYSIEVSPATPISELKAAGQKHFQRFLKLIAEGRQLDLTTAVVQLGKLAGTSKAFAWHGHGGEVVTWGDPRCGGDSSQVQEQLRNVQHIQASCGGAFAAILESGAVVTWGNPGHGGDSGQVQE